MLGRGGEGGFQVGQGDDHAFFFVGDSPLYRYACIYVTRGEEGVLQRGGLFVSSRVREVCFWWVLLFVLCWLLLLLVVLVMVIFVDWWYHSDIAMSKGVLVRSFCPSYRE